MPLNLNDLNESQRQAVLCCDAPSLVIAGAGSGKTRVLTYKIAYLLEQGMHPSRILALTFTNKAAREMRERIARLLGAEQAAPLWMGTFHSIFSRILRRESALLGFNSNFTIYDADDARHLVSDIIKEMQLNDKVYKPSAVASRISNAKNALLLPSDYQRDPNMRQHDQQNGMTAVGRIYERYFERCRQANAMDFDDLLLYTWLLLRDHPDVAERYQERFEFVLVDEYQDTNYAQHQIVWLLTNRRQRLSVVGDDAQSIYSFRGANIDNILQFQQRYTGTRLFKLEQNYRSTQTIVGAAGSLIAHNQRQIRKDVYSRGEQGNPIPLYTLQSDIEESIVVAREIRRLLRDEHVSPSQVAVLYRTNAQSRSLEEHLRKGGIPYRIYGGTSFYQRKEIKDCISYMRLVVNPHDELALLRVINYPARGIGATTIQRLSEAAVSRGVPMWQVILNPLDVNVSRGTLTKLNDFAQLIAQYQACAHEADAYTLAKEMLTRSGLIAELMKGHDPEDKTRQENVQELLDHLSTFVQDRVEEGESALLTDYLSEVSLLTDADQESEADQERVTLMTVHASKGLEFDAVFVVGMEENLFPSQMSFDSPREMEEERRLFYVAMTRARKYLTLTCARTRFRFGKVEVSQPSRFLHDIDARFLTNASARTSSSAASVAPQRSFKPIFRQVDTPSQTTAKPLSRPVGAPSYPTAKPLLRPLSKPSASPSAPASSALSGSSFAVNQRVVHARFGAGVVQSLEGTGMDAKATVLFDSGETRKLLLRFANLSPCAEK